MVFITHLLAEEPERLAGPFLADTYATLLKGPNACNFCILIMPDRLLSLCSVPSLAFTSLIAPKQSESPKLDSW
ncbi:hypothetical protein VNO78_21395 [Psophocarpus tetragonolobus]|uniref:Uncharacterized protein n=1 Tax=Psophocarpus tetragonolobus TaxID=3891 RepID=A0AAN9SD86_PSOTE